MDKITKGLLAEFSQQFELGDDEKRKIGALKHLPRI